MRERVAEVRVVVLDELQMLLEEDDKHVPVIEDDTVLLEIGLDSLGFAVLVTRLEDSLGHDPFTEMDDPVYPRTLGEFVNVYAQA